MNAVFAVRRDNQPSAAGCLRQTVLEGAGGVEGPGVIRGRLSHTAQSEGAQDLDSLRDGLLLRSPEMITSYFHCSACHCSIRYL